MTVRSSFMLLTRRFDIALNLKSFVPVLLVVTGLALIAVPSASFAQAAVNQDCTLIVPHNPLTASGLATPYQLVATNPANGPCHEADKNQSAFVQAAILDKDTGQISIYGPLVMDRGTTPAVSPVVPTLPSRHIVALWFGFNANNLSLAGYDDDLRDNHCRQGMGQFAYCNAVAFFHEAEEQIEDGKLVVPPLGISPRDHRVCPSVRSFAHVDQDQSDNVTTIYLFTTNGQVAQNTAANRTKLSGSVARGNPSDNRLLDVFIDEALGCTPWTAPDLADPGAQVPALPLNELQAAKFQRPPIARIPLGDPFVLKPPITGVPSLARVNRYRRGVYQQRADDEDDASTTTYCRNIRQIHTAKLNLDRPFFTAFRSVDPAVANNLFTFMAQRYVVTYQILGCEALLNLPVNVSLTTDAKGVVVDASIQ
jgi:hypothetical protein